MSPAPAVGYAVDVIDEPVPVAAPTATDTVFVVHTAAVAEPALQKLTSKADARTYYPATASLIALADAFFEEGGAKMWVSKLGTSDLTTVALPRFTANMGPGQVIAPEVVTGPLHVALAQWAWDTNRIAILDAADAASDAAIITLATTVIAGEGRNAEIEADTLIIPGIASGTTREVPASIVKAALMARSDILTGNPNLAAAGIGNARGRTRYVIGIKAERTDAARQTLAAAQVNTFKSVYGQYVTAYDYVTLANLVTLPQWWDVSGSRTVMAARAQEAAVAEQHLFGNIDGQGEFLTRYEGALRGKLADLLRLGALYGSDTSPGYRVDVSPVVNPLTNLAIGKVTAQIVLRTSPFARALQINVVRRAISREVN